MKNNQVPMEQMYPLMVEMLRQNGTVEFTVTGYSMQPMVYNRRDTVILKKPVFPLKKYDLPFYRMDDGTFYLHRVIRVHSDGTYECRGDNRWESEDPIRNDQIIGIVTAFTRKGKKISVNNFFYRLYVRIWKYLHPFKKFYHFPQSLRLKCKKQFQKFTDLKLIKSIKITAGAGKMQKIKIRPAKEADLPVIYELSQKLCDYENRTFDLPNLVLPDWAETVKGQQYMHRVLDKQFLWVAVVENKPIGYCMGTISNSYSNAFPIAQLSNIYIKEDYRNAGIGGMFIETFKEFCRKRNCHHLKVTFVEQNKTAEALYKKHGFDAYEKTYYCETE